MMISRISNFTPIKNTQNFKASQDSSLNKNNQEIIDKYNELSKIKKKLDLLKRLHQEDSPEYYRLNAEMSSLYKNIALLESGIFYDTYQ